MDFLNKLKTELSGAPAEQVPAAAAAKKSAMAETTSEISREDLVHLTMKLSKRLKVAESKEAKTATALEAARSRADVVCSFLGSEILDDPSLFDDADADVDLKETLRSRWEKRRLEMSAPPSDDKESELRAALERSATALRDARATFEEARRGWDEQKAAHEEQVVYLKMKVDTAADAAAASQRQEDLASRLETLRSETQRLDAALRDARRDKEATDERCENAEAQLFEREALIARLQTENAAAENKHATRTRELRHVSEELRRVTSELERTRRSDLEERSRERAVFVAALARSAAALSCAETALRVAETQRSAAKFALDEDKAFAEKENARKSQLARQIVVEKDAKITALKERVSELETDAARGGHAHRRIVEIARAQAQRDGAVHAQVRSHKVTNIKLRRGLEKRDQDLAALTKRVASLTAQLRDAEARVTRENLDVEYVKNVVVQYLALPDGSSERASLVPVLATVLHFSDADARAIQKGSTDLSSSSSSSGGSGGFAFWTSTSSSSAGRSAAQQRHQLDHANGRSYGGGGDTRRGGAVAAPSSSNNGGHPLPTRTTTSRSR